MTKRAFWDELGGLWEETDDPSILRLVWVPSSGVCPLYHVAEWHRGAIENNLGPLVGVA